MEKIEDCDTISSCPPGTVECEGGECALTIK
jgi:hypothetical protein